MPAPLGCGRNNTRLAWIGARIAHHVHVIGRAVEAMLRGEDPRRRRRATEQCPAATDALRRVVDLHEQLLQGAAIGAVPGDDGAAVAFDVFAVAVRHRAAAQAKMARNAARPEIPSRRDRCVASHVRSPSSVGGEGRVAPTSGQTPRGWKQPRQNQPWQLPFPFGPPGNTPKCGPAERPCTAGVRLQWSICSGQGLNSRESKRNAKVWRRLQTFPRVRYLARSIWWRLSPRGDATLIRHTFATHAARLARQPVDAAGVARALEHQHDHALRPSRPGAPPTNPPGNSLGTNRPHRP